MRTVTIVFLLMASGIVAAGTKQWCNVHLDAIKDFATQSASRLKAMHSSGLSASTLETLKQETRRNHDALLAFLETQNITNKDQLFTTTKKLEERHIDIAIDVVDYEQKRSRKMSDAEWTKWYRDCIRQGMPDLD